MASTAAQLARLAADDQFVARVSALFLQQAQVLYPEAPRTITAITAANPGVITSAGHGLTVGVTTTVVISGSNCTPSLNGTQTVYVVSSSQLRTTVNITGAGTTGTFTVPARLAFASYVLANVAGVSANLVTAIANSTNLVGGNTIWDWANDRPVTDVTDAAIASQISTLWSMFSGV